jgi:pantoate--beta-alanine ligase
MGYLHEGHLQLVRRARDTGNSVAVTIFVNPTQFGPNEDFAKYPRNLCRDLELLSDLGVSWVFTPSTEEIYTGSATHAPCVEVHVPVVTEYFDGVSRPGHFVGVATVVNKLFNICRPSCAIFGLKDLQQCAVIKRMVSDMNMAVQLIFEPTKREEDGLAMSSRNAYLSQTERSIAPVLYQRLQTCAKKLDNKESIESVISKATESLAETGFDVDYLDLVDIAKFAPTREISLNSALVVAAKLGRTRLIDNLILFPTESFL